MKKMNRAEERRWAREEAKKDVKYELTYAQIKAIEVNAIKRMEEKLMRDTVNRAIAVSRSLMIAVTMNVLGHCYWEKSAKQRLPKLMEECNSLYDSIEAGAISINELIQDTAEMGNLKSEYFDILKNDKDMWDKINWKENA
jgi:hypothetical protein